MTAPVYETVASASLDSGTSIVSSKPASLAIGNIMLAQLYYESNSAITVTPHTGFAEYTACAADNTGPNPDFHSRAYWKRAVQADIDVAVLTFGFSGTVAALINVFRISGAVATGTPIEDGDKVTGNSTSCTLPSIDTLTADTLIIGMSASFDWSKTWSSSALTERVDANGQAGYTGTQAAAGASGTKLITQSGTDQFAGMICNIASIEYTPPAGGITPHADHYARMRQS